MFCARHRALMGKRSDAILESLGQSLALNVAIGLTTPRIDQWYAALAAHFNFASPHPEMPSIG